MRPILTDAQYNRATYPLKQAVDRLNQAANARPGLTTVAEPGRVRRGGVHVVPSPRFDPLFNPGTPQQRASYQQEYVQTFAGSRGNEWAAHMEGYIRKTYPRATPTDDAVRSIGSWLSRAIDCDYPVHDSEIRELLCSVILMERTEGYTDADTTGTQMGNFRGAWRGGGFGD